MKENKYVICQVLISQGSFVSEMSLPVYLILQTTSDILEKRELMIQYGIHPTLLLLFSYQKKKTYFTAIKEDVVNNVPFHNVVYLKLSTRYCFMLFVSSKHCVQCP
jgi:hypothetical protein